MSDSGVFETLYLNRILAAAKQEGVYHHNIIMTLELGSPHLVAESRLSAHEVSTIVAVPISFACRGCGSRFGKRA